MCARIRIKCIDRERELESKYKRTDGLSHML